MPDQLLYTVEEAAQRLRYGRTRTYALVKSGDIGSVKVGRLRRIPAPALEDYARRLMAEVHATAA